MKELKGELRLGRISSSTEKDFMSIELVDEGSGCRVVEMRFPLNSMADLMTSHTVDCDFCFNDTGLIGKKREHKELLVKQVAYSSNYKNALKPFEIDGWRGREKDMGNHHRWVGKKVKVLFERWV